MTGPGDDHLERLGLNAELIGLPGGAAALQTPALVLDLDAFEANMAKMRKHCEGHRVGLRPHTKTHKCVRIGELQMAAGAVGLCCAKLAEAEILVNGGLPNVLITSPVVTDAGIRRLIALNDRAREVIVVLDHADNARALAAAASADAPLNVLVDLDPGLHRTGILPGDEALALVRQIADAPSLRFRGLQMYAGNLMHVHDYAERRARSLEVMGQLAEFRTRLEDSGVAVDITSGGGTGSFDIDPDAGVLTDLQAGSYLFMDRQYNAIEPAEGALPPFHTSLLVQTTVVSCNRAGLATTDAGLKAFATDDETPIVRQGGPQGAGYFFFGDEHGGFTWKGGETVAPGDWLRAETPHCDPTFNLYDVVHCVRGDVLEDIWSIDARGASQ